MRLLTERAQVDRALATWVPKLVRMGGENSPYAPLAKLVEGSATATELASAAQTTELAEEILCGECGNPSWSAVEIGEPLDEGSLTAMVCIDCLRTAVKLLEDAGCK